MGTPYEGVECALCARPFAAAEGFARERELRAGDAAAHGNSAVVNRVEGRAMLTSAIVFGMVGVVAGFTWDYVINRGK